MTSGFHPVSLHVIRGALTFVGFEVGRIRCLIKSQDGTGPAKYRVQIVGIEGVAAEQCPPAVVEHAARCAFAKDVQVTAVEFDGVDWFIILWTEVPDGRDTAGGSVDSGDDGELYSDNSPVEVAGR